MVRVEDEDDKEHFEQEAAIEELLALEISLHALSGVFGH